MELTLAMGLKYEPGAGYQLLTDFHGGQEKRSVRPEKSQPVIDVEAIEIREGEVVQSAKSRRFDYLVYNFQAGIVTLPLIGSKLDTTI